jgi:hypothetical protein
MKEQKEIIKQYMELNNNPTMRWVSADTGIQLTRVFRLMNGCLMKLDEYFAFKNKVIKKLSSSYSFSALAMQCEDKLSQASLAELSQYMKRSLKQKRFLDSNLSFIQTAS